MVNTYSSKEESKSPGFLQLSQQANCKLLIFVVEQPHQVDHITCLVWVDADHI